MNSRTLAMFLRWKNDVFITLLMWDLRLTSESKIMPRLVTSDLIQGVNFPRLLHNISLFVLGLTSRISDLSLFYLKKLLLHVFIARRQVVMEFKAAASFDSAEIHTVVCHQRN